MALDADYIYEGLLRYNYFPMVKEHRDDTPPLFSSERLAPKIAERLAGLPDSGQRRKSGYDQIEYRTTRFNNVLRLMHIPHPLPFARLCACLRDNWDHLTYICSNNHSRIKPQRHADGRIYVLDAYDEVKTGRVVVMGKERFSDELREHLTLSLGARYRVEADVSGCFPSLYSHAIPWALVGHSTAKNNRGPGLWYNQIDACQRQLKRNETQGVPIGPATSNIINEVILARVDEALGKKDYRFFRHIDDYKCYCNTQAAAEEFIRDLERELSSFLLSLNVQKVAIEALPIPSNSAWVTELLTRLPQGKEATVSEVANTLDAALYLQSSNRDGSVVKYAARSLAGKLSENTAPLYCRYTLQLAFHYPVVLPILCEVVKRYNVKLSKDDIAVILHQQITYRRSDMICWTLYLVSLVTGGVPDCAAEKIVSAGDCMGMASLLAIGQHESRVIDHVRNLDCAQPYELDRNWLLIHELALRRKWSSNGLARYVESSGLDLLVGEGVSFLATQKAEDDE